MQHWKTNEEMGEGWSHSRSEHEKSSYNYLENPRKDELILLRTTFLIRDVWTPFQILNLINTAIELFPERVEGQISCKGNITEIREEWKKVEETVKNVSDDLQKIENLT